MKEHGEYKCNKQTLVTRCRFGVKEKEKKKNLPTAEEGCPMEKDFNAQATIVEEAIEIIKYWIE